MKRLLILSTDIKEIPSDFWNSDSCEILVIKRWHEERPGEAERLRDELPDLPGHVWFTSSGTLATPGASKWIALSKKAILASAHAVNTHLGISASDSWGLTLPLAHVGGMGIIARAHLLKQRVQTLTPERWNPVAVAAGAWDGEWLSLVPTQVHDLVTLGLQPPHTLKGVIVGGDRLNAELERAAIELGWPILTSFGLTECASQVATAQVVGGKPKVLPHIKLKTDSDERLWILSPALYSAIALVDTHGITLQKRRDEWWATQDRAQIINNELHILGRIDQVIKVRGEKVDLTALEKELEMKLASPLILTALPHERNGYELWLVSESKVDINSINQGLLSHQRLAGQKVITTLPRTALGKIKRGEVLDWLKKQGTINL